MVLLCLAYPARAYADCPPAPLASPNDMAVSFLAAHGTQIAPASLLASSIKEGVLVYDGAAGKLKICDGTNWSDLGGTQVPDGSVSYTKIQNVSGPGKLLGRASAGAGVVEEITIGSGLTLTGSTLSADGGVQSMTTLQRDAIALPAEGMTIYNSTAKLLEFYNGTNWISMVTAKGGSSPADAASSCSAILAAGYSAGNGLYWLTGSSGNFQTYCNMTIFGGGWMLAMNLDTSDGSVRAFDATFWTDAVDVGTAANALSADFKQGSLFQRPVSEILIVVHEEGTVLGHASWSLSSTGSLQSKLASASNTIITSGGKTSSAISGIHTRETVILPAGNLVANFDDGTQDRARLRNSGGAISQNTTGGLGYQGDYNQGYCSRPCVDAALNATPASTWTSHWLGTDIHPSNQYGSASGLNYDYAIFAR